MHRGQCSNNTTASVKVTVLQNTGTTYYWKGTTSTNWATASNWCSAVPTSTNNVVIPSGTSNSPVIQANDAVCKDLTINSGATLSLNTTYTLGVYGNWDNDGTFTPASGTVHFKGITDQSIDGSSTQTFYNLTINNSGTTGNDEITLIQPVTVTNQLTLTDGKIVSTSSDILNLTNTATTAANGGNAGSFVSGPITWSVTGPAGGPYVFPTGKDTKWARVALSSVSGAGAFTCEYFNTAYISTATSDISTADTYTLTNVSVNEYWDVDRTSGTANAAVTLYWEDADAAAITSCAVDGDLVVAHFRGDNKWHNENDDGTVVTSDVASCVGNASGYVTSDIITSFSPQTFGNTGGSGVNPLPIELLSFTAVYNGKYVDVKWVTATEINNDYFTIERSKDGINFEVIAVVPSQAFNGNSAYPLSYYLQDNWNVSGTYYYRLKQTDYDGKYSYSAVATVVIKKGAEFLFTLSPNPNNGQFINALITAEANQIFNITVFDILGQVLYKHPFKTENDGLNSFPLHFTETLSPGTYIFTAISETEYAVSKNVIVY